MSISIDLDDELYQAAQTAAQAECRSVAQQIEYWTRLGRMMAETPGLAYAQLQRKLAGTETTMEQAYVVAPAVSDPDERQRRLREAFDQLAASGAFADIEDPVAWQREQRRDSPLPGRED